MHDQKRARISRLWIWFTINLVIFVVCYLNYRLQLKHRYLYKTLDVGLCLSRAAAMVINFNLLLVWLPMCKYTLTRLACMASGASSRQKHKLQELKSSPMASSASSLAANQHQQTSPKNNPPMATCASEQKDISNSLRARLLMKLKWSVNSTIWRFHYWFCLAKLNYINSFLVAVDHCTSLHTICATTITLASVIHTVAHLMNVMNFSKNFDPLLGNLNMAEHKGQNPFQLLVSVPGITGFFLMVILLLMSLSSLASIRNSSFDLFQIFHRLSVVFVLLLILHPSSHVLKEQSNVDRHNPDICHKRMLLMIHNETNNENLKETYSSMSRKTMTLEATNNTDDNDNPSFAVRSSTIVRQRTVRGRAPNTAPNASSSSGVAARSGATEAASTTATATATGRAAAADSSAPTGGVRHNLAPKSLVRSPSPHSAMHYSALRGGARASGHNDTGLAIQADLGQKVAIPLPGTSQDGRNKHKHIRRNVDNYDYDYVASDIVSHNNNNKTRISDLKQTNFQHNESRTTNGQSQREQATDEIKVNDTIRLPNLNNDKDLITEPNSASLQFNYAPRNNDTTNDTPIVTKKQIKHNNTNNNNDHSDGDGHSDSDDHSNEPCLDGRPLFVAQSSILWFVLSAGLSCYLLDLILRRLRRSKSTIQLLDVRSDSEGNLIELILSNNHRRFAHWLPGQFVYLNCPQIAAHEWHPFTISTMDNRTRQFTLHIKTGGDWTRKLRHELQLRGRQSRSMSLFGQLYQGYHCGKADRNIIESNSITTTTTKTIPPTTGIGWIGHRTRLPLPPPPPSPSPPPPTSGISDIHCQITNVDSYDHKTGQLQIECKKITHLHGMDCGADDDYEHKCCQSSVRINLNDDIYHHHVFSGTEKPYLVCGSSLMGTESKISYLDVHDQRQQRQQSRPTHPPDDLKLKTLQLYIDGPFHSPFERLLEQQVSVCIANGVGWTAFSSVFQRITNNLPRLQAKDQDNWWSKWRDYALSGAAADLSLPSSLIKDPNANGQHGEIITPASEALTDSLKVDKRHEASLHLLVIVTTVEQLKPFYSIARTYFNLIEQECRAYNTVASCLSPVKEVKAFITRSAHNDADVIEFCRRENLRISSAGDTGGLGGGVDDESSEVEDNIVKVNDVFSVHFGKPDFGAYLATFRTSYPDRRKISVYCCGSHQVKRSVEQICQDLNKKPRDPRRSSSSTCPHQPVGHRSSPKFCYHEENF